MIIFYYYEQKACTHIILNLAIMFSPTVPAGGLGGLVDQATSQESCQFTYFGYHDTKRKPGGF